MSSVGAAIGIAGAVGNAVIGSSAAGNAAQAQETAAQQAQALELQNQQNAQNFQTNEWTGTQTAEQPYQAEGSTAANNLTNLLKAGFQAPTLQQAENEPGYQFVLSQGTQALDQSAAATGNLYSGTQGKALTNYGQQLATTDYQQVYNNALQGYMANYQSLLGGTNLGLSSTGQLASAGQAASNNMANLALQGGAQQATQLNNYGAAEASGYINQANVYENAVNGVTQDVLGTTPFQQTGTVNTSSIPSGGAISGTAGVAGAIPLPGPVPNPMPAVNPLAVAPYMDPFASSYGLANS